MRDAPEIQGLLWPDPKRLGVFELDSTDGEAVDLARLEGRWTFLFFGFTFCPDVCPTTLTTMAAAMKQMREAEAARLLEPRRPLPTAPRAERAAG